MRDLIYTIFENPHDCKSGEHRLAVIVPGFGQDLSVTQALAQQLNSAGLATLAYEQARYLDNPRSPFSEKTAQLEELLALPDVWTCPACQSRREVILVAHSQGSTLIGLAFYKLLVERNYSQLHRTTVVLFNSEIPILRARTKFDKVAISLKQWKSIINSASIPSVRSYMRSTVGFILRHPYCAYADLKDGGIIIMDRMAQGYEKAVKKGVKILFYESRGDPWFDEESSRSFCNNLGTEVKIYEDHSHDWLMAQPEASTPLIKKILSDIKVLK